MRSTTPLGSDNSISQHFEGTTLSGKIFTQSSGCSPTGIGLLVKLGQNELFDAKRFRHA
jgi:hypothetical protein